MTQVIYDSLTSIGWRFTKHTGEVGLEIETESKTRYERPVMKFWEAKDDGSLRDFGVEYISKPVSRGVELRAALNEFKQKTDHLKFIPDSISTSVHVHINFLNDKWITLANFMTLYYLVEPLLIRYSGPDRISNLFCLPIRDAEAQIENATGFISSIGSRRYKSLSLAAENVKYSALNLGCFSKLGTMEVRTFRGVTDVAVIENWVNILMSIKDYAATEGLTPVKILEMFRDLQGEIIYPIFGIFVGELNFPDKVAEMKKNLWYARKIATASTKFSDEWGFPKPKKMVKEHYREQLNKISNEKYKMNYDELDYVYQLVIDEEFYNLMGGAPVVFDGDDQ